MTRFLIDEDLPRRIALGAASRGVDALHVVDVGLRGKPDPDVLRAAVTGDRALVTADKEFGNVLVYTPTAHRGVVLVRIPEDTDPDQRIMRVIEAIVELANDDIRGSVAIVEPSRVRIRRTRA